MARITSAKAFFGQEINLTTYNLCRINMFLHDIDYDKFDIAHEDTLVNPQHWDDEPFEVIVSNPPYSIKWEGDDNPVLINDPPVFAGWASLAPKSKADLAFIMHSPGLAGHQWHSRHCLFPWHHVPWRRGKENPPVSDRQQLH